MIGATLAERLRLIVITDGERAAPRRVVDVVRSAVEAGAPAIQLRDKTAGARTLAAAARALLGVTRPAGALLFVNDRVDVALAVAADGVHVGPDDLPVAEVRRAVEAARGSLASVGQHEGAPAADRPFFIGTSTDDPVEARHLVAAGADYVGCGTVYATASKADAGAVIGLDGLQGVAAAVDVPVVGIGGVTVERAAEIRARTDASGVAVIGAVMGASDVAATVRGLIAPWQRGR